LLQDETSISYGFMHNAIVKDFNLTETARPVPAKVLFQLHAFKDLPPFNLNFN
jgi:hypothetical protein